MKAIARTPSTSCGVHFRKLCSVRPEATSLSRQEWILRAPEWILRAPEWILRAPEWILRVPEWILRAPESRGRRRHG
eukprot:1985402-Pyramimonas_sp.AAC.1